MTAIKRSGVCEGWRREDGIIHVKCGNESNEHFVKQDALDVRNLLEDLGGGQNQLLLLCDIKHIKKTDSEARYVHPPEGTAKLAILVGSPVSRMLGATYLGFRRPKCPTRLFTQEQTALQWLLSPIPSK